MSEFKFGTVSVPDGVSGDWRVSTFTITDDHIGLSNLRAIRDGNREMMLSPGEYKRLTCKGRGVVMSNTPMERRTAIEAFHSAEGKVLVNGLGLGMVLEGMLSKPEVESVRVIEVSQDVINLVAPTFLHDPRVEIILADAYKYKPGKDERFDYVWHDVWDEISSDNLGLMAILARKYGRKTAKQGFWSKDMALRLRREEKSRRGFW